jgi:anti-sigma B factor antagonist
MPLTIQEEKLDPDIVVLRMDGSICLGSACQDVERRVTDLMQRDTKKIIFDLGGISLMDSTGVGLLVACYGRLRKAGGDLRLAALQPRIQEILRMTSVDRVIKVFPTASAAAENFPSAAS